MCVIASDMAIGSVLLSHFTKESAQCGYAFSQCRKILISFLALGRADAKILPDVLSTF